MILRYFLLFLVLAGAAAPADEAKPPAMPRPAVDEVAAKVRPGLLTVINTGREGYAQGLGTGFVISKDGLVATNLHVVGESRPIEVELQDGRRPKVREVHAWSRKNDLIIFRIDAADLTPLELGPVERMAQGTAVVAMGNPLGLRYSVVDGVVSETREIDGQELIQLAMPIEKGNSGGPLVDGNGRVRGIVNMKSAVTENLGYAIPVAALKAMLDNPAPVKIENWMTIGTLNAKLWKPTEATWTQRAGKILAHGVGESFGGRALCIHQVEPPELPYEVSVRVKLDDESGAAGLIFCADGGDVHYGFYPTAGKLRLTRFGGPDLAHWEILQDVASPHYNAGEWNHLRVRVDAENLTCYVNGHEAITSTDTVLRSGRVGLCKFRQTEPEFRDFRLGRSLSGGDDDAGITLLRRTVAAVGRGDGKAADSLGALSRNPAAARNLIDEELRLLELRAGELRRLSSSVHESSVAAAMAQVFKESDASANLAEAALLVAKLDNPELDVAAYLGELDRLAQEFRAQLTDEEKKNDGARLSRLLRWMFEESGFHGSRDDYYSKSNSYLNEVIDDREGLPVTLAVLFIEIAGRVDLPMAGIPLPGHFMVQHRPADNPDSGDYFDLFERGRRFTREEAFRHSGELLGRDPEDSDFAPASKRQIIVRMLRNLIGIQLDQKASEALPYLNLLLSLAPEEPGERLSRAILLFQSGRKNEAKTDITWLLEKSPPGVDLDRLQRWLESIEENP